MDKWKPDRSGQFLTVVYKDVVPGNEVGALHDHPKCVAVSWSNALHDVDYLRNRVPQQRTWVGLTDEEISEAYNAAAKKALYCMGATREDVYEAIEAKLKEKNT